MNPPGQKQTRQQAGPLKGPTMGGAGAELGKGSHPKVRRVTPRVSHLLCMSGHTALLCMSGQHYEETPRKGILP